MKPKILFSFSLFDLIWSMYAAVGKVKRSLKKFWHLHSSNPIYYLYLELSAFLFLLSRINQMMTFWFRMRCLRTLCTIHTTSGSPSTSPSSPSFSICLATSGSRWRGASWSSSGRGPQPGLLRTRTRRGRSWSSFSAEISITSETANIMMQKYLQFKISYRANIILILCFRYNIYFCGFVFCEFLNFAIVGCNFFLTHRFLHYRFLDYGYQVSRGGQS